MSAVYDNLGIRFMYPENWQVTQEQSGDIPFEISVETPGGGFWSVYVHLNSADPQELAAATLEAMNAEYDSLEYWPITESIDDLDANGYELNFYCLDFLVTARVIGFRCGDHTLLVMYQAESRDFSQLEQVFQAVTTSLRRFEREMTR